ncbi:MAG: riboflavin synthase [Verrucomicrobiae bacterium]|nr:riboflavin synthase [Verrucomicrobiae bacterium]
MFTGLVEETGVVEGLVRRPGAADFVVRAGRVPEGLSDGDSIAVNGACLTVSALAGGAMTFHVLEETLRLTNFEDLKPGDRVNLERALRADARLGGHFVSGHIDGTGILRRWERSGGDFVLEVECPPAVARYLIVKGSIAMDGISLTVAGVEGNICRVWIIPHTREVTNLRDRKPGDRINLEADLIGKYVEKFVSARPVP